MVDHDAFIDSLSRTIAPVKRPPPPVLRAALWIAGALPCGALITLGLGRALADWSAPLAMWAVLQLISAFILGSMGIASAFALSIAGREVTGWPWFAVVAILWIMASIVCVAYAPDNTWHPGSGSGCYTYMVTASLPMIALSILSLSQTRTLYSVRSLAAAGVGVAFMTMTLLSLCHPVIGNLPDFVMHLVAAATIIAATIGFGRHWVTIR